MTDTPNNEDAAADFRRLLMGPAKSRAQKTAQKLAALTDEDREALKEEVIEAVLEHARIPAANPRWCFTIQVGQRNEHGYIPSVVFENESGHHPLIGRGELSEPWYWGQDYDEAKAVCARANAELGLSETDVADIVSSSIAAQLREDSRRETYHERMRQLGLRDE